MSIMNSSMLDIQQLTTTRHEPDNMTSSSFKALVIVLVSLISLASGNTFAQNVTLQGIHHSTLEDDV